MKRKKAKADPILTEIVRNGVLAVTEEMKSNLMRTAYNMIIYEALDFTVGLFTADGRTVSIGMGLPSFIRGMANVVKAELEHFGPEGLEPGSLGATLSRDALNRARISTPLRRDEKPWIVQRALAPYGTESGG